MWAAVVCLLLAAATVRPALSSWFPQTAIDVAAWEAWALGPKEARGPDPWARAWLAKEVRETRVGIGAGPPFVHASQPPPRDRGILVVFASSPGLAVLALVCVSYVPWIRLARSPSRSAELVRAAGASIPAAFLGLLVAGAITWTQPPSAFDTPLVRGPIALTLSPVGLAYLVALAVRMTRPLAGATADCAMPAPAAAAQAGP